MARGKQTCKILKEIRRQIAEANDIEFVTADCKYKGDCLGTCPKCEEEVRYLERQLRARRLAGKAVSFAGISASALALLTPISVSAQTTDPNYSSLLGKVAVYSTIDTIIVKGKVLATTRNKNGKTVTEPLIGTTIRSAKTGCGTATNIDGEFQIKSCIGDSLTVKYVGYHDKTIFVTDAINPSEVEIVMSENDLSLQGIVEIVQITDREHVLKIKAVDKTGNTIDPDDLYIEYLQLEEDGKKYYDSLPYSVDDSSPYATILWNKRLYDADGTPQKKAILRITAHGYEDSVAVKAKYPKRSTTKTIIFKRQKK